MRGIDSVRAYIHTQLMARIGGLASVDSEHLWQRLYVSSNGVLPHHRDQQNNDTGEGQSLLRGPRHETGEQIDPLLHERRVYGTMTMSSTVPLSPPRSPASLRYHYHDDGHTISAIYPNSPFSTDDTPINVQRSLSIISLGQHRTIPSQTFVKTVFPYTASRWDELTWRRCGQLILVVEAPEGGWWRGVRVVLNPSVRQNSMDPIGYQGSDKPSTTEKTACWASIGEPGWFPCNHVVRVKHQDFDKTAYMASPDDRVDDIAETSSLASTVVDVSLDNHHETPRKRPSLNIDERIDEEDETNGGMPWLTPPMTATTDAYTSTSLTSPISSTISTNTTTVTTPLLTSGTATPLSSTSVSLFGYGIDAKPPTNEHIETQLVHMPPATMLPRLHTAMQGPSASKASRLEARDDHETFKQLQT